MRITLLVVGWVTAVAALPVAAAASAADIFHKHGLFGTWAVDCARPPSIANPHVVYRLIDGNRVQRQTSVEAGRILDLSTIETAAEAGASELIISWQTGEGGITNKIRLGDGWMQVVESTRSNGQRLVVNGRRVRDNSEAPRFTRCSAAQTARTPVARKAG
jgi:hypothetical protein